MSWPKGKPRGKSAVIPIGVKFNRMTVLGRDDDAKGRVRWMCQCDCGATKSVAACELKAGKTKSCGCFDLERKTFDTIKHGYNRTPTYVSWSAMWARCTNSKLKSYKNYGGRGISVCERWKDFQNFLDDMGARPDGKSLDRYPDNDGNYEPNNCRWATAKEQRANQRPVRAAAAIARATHKEQT